MFHLRVNLSSPMSTHSAHHELLPTDGENSIRCELSISKDANCGIFDIATGDVEIEEVPVTWDIDGHSYNTLTMSCGHTFNPSAAALHFLSQDMRCPICRRGSETQMLIESLPGHLQETFSEKLNGMKERSKTEDSMLDLLQLIEVDVAGIESDFCLVVDISVKTHSRVLLQSPIRSLSLNDGKRPRGIAALPVSVVLTQHSCSAAARRASGCTEAPAVFGVAEILSS